jgi:peroxiredoxin Q/BCP
MAAMVAIGKKIPAFSLAATGGKTFRARDARGANLVLYFYPRDNTTGCTSEGEAFRDLHPKFLKANALILGVSADTIESHEKFKAKYRFPFDLLADPDREVCVRFNVIREKSMYGRKFMGIERSTFLFDADGVLRREWRKVKVPGHAQQVLEAVQEL